MCISRLNRMYNLSQASVHTERVLGRYSLQGNLHYLHQQMSTFTGGESVTTTLADSSLRCGEPAEVRSCVSTAAG